MIGVILSEIGSYEEITRHIGGNITKGVISKFLKWNKGTISLQNQTNRCRKMFTTASNDRKNKRLCIGDEIKLSGNVQAKMAPIWCWV